MTHNKYVLDTETTGLDSSDQIIELGIVDAVTGQKVFQSLFRPTVEVSEEALNVHGISPDMLKDAPTFTSKYRELKSLLSDSVLYIYNGDFDVRLLDQTLQAFELEPITFKHVHCVMLEYASLYRDYNPRSDLFDLWVSLENACDQQGIDCSDLNAHSAIDDCIMTYRLMQKIESGDINVSQEWLWHLEDLERAKKNRKRAISRAKRVEKIKALCGVSDLKRKQGSSDIFITPEGVELPYFAMSRPYHTVTLSQLTLANASNFECVGTCCNSYGDRGFALLHKDLIDDYKGK